MKLWFPTWPLFNYPNPNWPFSGNTLYRRHRNSLFISRPHLPRRKLRLTHSKYSCQWCILLLYLHLYAHRPGFILRLLSLQRNMKHWSCSPSPSNNNRLCWVRPALRTNIFLGCDRHYQPSVSSPLHWQYPCSMDLRRLLSR